jgi:hypothetical protein
MKELRTLGVTHLYLEVTVNWVSILMTAGYTLPIELLLAIELVRQLLLALRTDDKLFTL